MADLGTHSGDAKAVVKAAVGGNERHFRVSVDGQAADGAKANKAFEVAAGASINIIWTTRTAGLAPPGQPTSATVEVYDANTTTLIRTFTVAAGNLVDNGSETFAFFATSDGTAGGTPRAGTVRLRVRAILASAPANPVTDYDVNSDAANPGNTPPQGGGHDHGRGYLRVGTSLASLVYSAASLGGAAPTNNRFTYPNSQFFRATLGAQAFPNAVRTATLTQRQESQGTPQRTSDAGTFTTSNPAVLDITRTGGVGAASGVNNDFANADTDTRVRIALGTETLSGRPWTHISSMPAGWSGTTDGGGNTTGNTTISSPTTLYKVDPGIFFTQLLQLNDSAFGTPPSIKNVASGQRLAADLAFIAARATDAHGTGINGVTWTDKLWDTGELVGTEASPWGSRTATSTTKGGQPGWADAFLTWDAQLPGGGWRHKQIITGPSKATALDRTNERTLTLLAENPNFLPVVFLSPSTAGAESDHWHSGEPLRVTYRVIDKATRTNKLFDASPAPSLILRRFNPTAEQDEYLDGSFTWQTGGPATEHAMTQAAGDPTVWTLVFGAEQTEGWGDFDLIAAVCTGFINSTPYPGHNGREAVAHANSHAAHEIDPIAFALMGGLSTR